MNKASERYNTKVEVPISVILETIFNDDNQDVEILSRWAEKYGFVDLIEKEGKEYYQLQNDYTKQSFYILLDKEERKQYDYEDYLLDKNEKLKQENQQLKDNWNKLKQIAKSQSDFKQKLGNDRVYFEIDELLDKMQELEKGDSNEY